MISISNAIYLASVTDLGKRPIIGYQSILTINDITADSETADNPAVNMWSPDTSSYWQSDTIPTGQTLYIYFENPSQYDIDYIGIARHNFFTGNIVYSLEMFEPGTSTWTAIIDQETVGDDAVIFHYFDTVNEAQLRLKLECDITPPIIGHIKLGEVLILERPMYVGVEPPTLSPRSKRTTNVSQTGQYLGQVITQRWHQAVCEQKNVTPDFVRNSFYPFVLHCQGQLPDDGTAQGTYFYAWRPSDYPAEVIYGWTIGDIVPSNQRNEQGLMQFNFKIEGIAS